MSVLKAIIDGYTQLCHDATVRSLLAAVVQNPKDETVKFKSSPAKIRAWIK